MIRAQFSPGTRTNAVKATWDVGADNATGHPVMDAEHFDVSCIRGPNYGWGVISFTDKATGDDIAIALPWPLIKKLSHGLLFFHNQLAVDYACHEYRSLLAASMRSQQNCNSDAAPVQFDARISGPGACKPDPPSIAEIAPAFGVQAPAEGGGG